MFFPLSYLPRRYFGWLDARGGGDQAPAALVTAYSTILSLLRSVGGLGDVLLGESNACSPPGDRIYPVAIVVPGPWSETDDTDATRRIRTVTFEGVLAVRDPEFTAAFARLNALVSGAQAAIEGSDLGIDAQASRTRLDAGRYEPANRQGERRFILAGEFAYNRPLA
ncbi:MAG: hypothetical protein U0800_00065 [Isosphaeraceae bacterium]